MCHITSLHPRNGTIPLDPNQRWLFLEGYIQLYLALPVIPSGAYSPICYLFCSYTFKLVPRFQYPVLLIVV